MDCCRIVTCLSVCAFTAPAQTSTNINLTVTVGDENYTSSNSVLSRWPDST